MKYAKYLLIMLIPAFVACGNSAEEQEESKDQVETPVESEERDAEKAVMESSDQKEEGHKENVEHPTKAKESQKEQTLESRKETQIERAEEEKPVKKISFFDKSKGLEPMKDEEFDLMGYAAQEVAIVKNEKSTQENCGKIVALKNFNAEKAIRVVVEVKWKLNDQKNELIRVYKLKPNQIEEVGTSKSCNQEEAKINWKIVSAKYIN